VDRGEVLLEGKDLLDLTWNEMRARRGRDLAMIFQEPMTSLNPVFTIGNQIAEAVAAHGGSMGEGRKRAKELLERVGIDDPTRVLRQYPHELSGGMRQRVMIAIALAASPRLLIADEPSTALDVTVQAQLLDLLRGLRRDAGLSLILITHDLGVIAEIADRVMVLYAGRVAETAPVRTLFDAPAHPYTQVLLASIPDITIRRPRLATIPGTVPAAGNMPPGCRFAPRCSYRHALCEGEPPPLRPLSAEHEAACLRPFGELPA
jgi:oligopeptide/dipeptide ABC transporter ATP-binding protein